MTTVGHTLQLSVAPSDYRLFKFMQHGLADMLFRNVDEVRKWIDDRIAFLINLLITYQFVSINAFSREKE